MLPKTQMATSTEVEGETTIEVPPEMEEGLKQEEAQSQTDEKQTAVSPAEEAQQEQEKPVTEETETKPSEETKPSARNDRRWGKLIDKLKERTDEVDGLRSELSKLKGDQPVQQQQPAYGIQPPPWINQPQPPEQEEVTVDQVLGMADNLTKARISQYEAERKRIDKFSEDLSYIESQYPELNEKSEQYNNEANKKITKWFKSAREANPNIRLKDFVDDIMSFQKAGREKGQVEGTESAIKQASESAITPSGKGQVKPDVDWESMSLDDKEKWMKANGMWDW